MACSTCDGYQLVPDGDGDGVLVDCPDCHAGAGALLCPLHKTPLQPDLACDACIRIANAATARIVAGTLLDRAREAALEAA